MAKLGLIFIGMTTDNPMQWIAFVLCTNYSNVDIYVVKSVSQNNCNFAAGEGTQHRALCLVQLIVTVTACKNYFCMNIFIFIHHKGSTESNNEIIQYTIATAEENRRKAVIRPTKKMPCTW